jgi:phosphoesterase RecJ-like protein
MSLALHQQFSDALKRSKRPVIVLNATPTIDDFAAAFVIRAFLKQLDTPCDIVTSGGLAPATLKFLSTYADVRGDFSNINALSVRVNLDHAKVDGLTYVVDGRDLVVTITPKTGAWKNNDVRIACNDYAFDLVIALGVPDRKSLGDLQARYADFFLRTPMLVIDHGPSNEHFGTVNIVDLSATSVSEACFELLNRIDPHAIDSAIATTLFTGMMSKTKSFRAPSVTPKTLDTAQKLMEAGAKRDEIVEHLYRTRSVETLRLWGRALARLKSDDARGIVWTLVTKQDFVASGSTADVLRDVIDELFSTSPTAKIGAVLFETSDGHISAHLHATRPHDALALGAPFRPVGTRDMAQLSMMETDIVAAEKALISHIKQSRSA